MKAIADELIRITADLGVDYQRAATLSQSSILTHYKDVSGIIVIYAGFGTATIEEQATGGSRQSVDVTVYVMKRQGVVDETSENIDILLDEVASICEGIRARYNTDFAIAYTLEYTTTDPDMLVGYLMEFSVTIDAALCP